MHVSLHDSHPASDKCPPRRHPRLYELFRNAESRHFTDDELSSIEAVYPENKDRLLTARAVREIEQAVVDRMLEEILSQYPFEDYFEQPRLKLPRDWRYVLAYSVQAMVMDDAKWFDDKLLVWYKTILQAFDFPDRRPGGGGTLFSDPVLEERLESLPPKCRAIYHTYYRIAEEVGSELPEEQAALVRPYILQAANVLTEKY